ncbi:hypothetical protein BKA70DRAFT_1229104 [Coprinopsis sp. MPI-PUGE-AT-0042]|nr:hypothetical protein BKA70DRAFT_1229104 [Coprinopsis sp. MPI-PUGE-AT-0042]
MSLSEGHSPVSHWVAPFWRRPFYDPSTILLELSPWPCVSHHPTLNDPTHGKSPPRSNIDWTHFIQTLELLRSLGNAVSSGFTASWLNLLSSKPSATPLLRRVRQLMFAIGTGEEEGSCIPAAYADLGLSRRGNVIGAPSSGMRYASNTRDESREGPLRKPSRELRKTTWVIPAHPLEKRIPHVRPGQRLQSHFPGAWKALHVNRRLGRSLWGHFKENIWHQGWFAYQGKFVGLRRWNLYAEAGPLEGPIGNVVKARLGETNAL